MEYVQAPFYNFLSFFYPNFFKIIHTKLLLEVRNTSYKIQNTSFSLKGLLNTYFGDGRPHQ